MIRLAVRVDRAHAEIALAELLVLAPGGVEEVDAGDGVVEYVIYGAEGELPDLGDVRAAAGDALVEVSSSVVGDDWAQRWREFHQPLQLRGLRLRAPWHEPTPAGELEVVIDPGQAFGTGMHPTTRLCLEVLLELPRPVDPIPVADLDACADRLVQLALRGGGGDNVTVIVADVVDLDDLPDGGAPTNAVTVVGAAAISRHQPSAAADGPAARAASLLKQATPGGSGTQDGPPSDEPSEPSLPQAAKPLAMRTAASATALRRMNLGALNKGIPPV